jgi:predicted Zn-dependent peptidase
VCLRRQQATIKKNQNFNYSIDPLLYRYINMKKNYSLHKLDNGLRVVLAPLSSTKAVTVLVMYKVGSRNEPAEYNGAAHFIEHLMFKGSKRWPQATDISKLLDSLGAEYNAFTDKDVTGYYIKVAADKTDIALQVMADMLIDPLFKAKEILEEINMYEDTPRALVGELLESQIYKGHALGRRVIGQKKIISSIKKEELVNFKKNYYSTSHAVIALAGRVNDQAIKFLTKYFKTHNSRTVTDKNNKFTIKQSEPRVLVKFKQTEQVHLASGLPALSDNDERLSTLKVLSVILGGGMSSRLFVELREKRGLCYFVRAGLDTYEETGDLVIQSGLDKQRLLAALKAIVGELKKFKLKSVPAAELRKAKDQLKGGTILAIEHSEFRADWYAKEVLFREKVLSPEEKLRQIEKVTAHQVQSLAQDLFDTDRLNLAVIGPLHESLSSQLRNLLKV